MKTNEMTPQESLSIISDAIKNSRRRIEMNSALPLMLWGISVPLIALVVWYLWSHTGMPQWNYLWFVLTPVISLIQHFTIDRKLEKSKGFINDVLGYIWLSFGVFAVTVAVLGLFKFVPDITLTILIMMGFAATVSGLVVKNGWMTAGGLLSGLGLSVALKFLSGPDALLLLIPAAVLTLLLPGLYFKFKNR